MGIFDPATYSGRPPLAGKLSGTLSAKENYAPDEHNRYGAGNHCKYGAGFRLLRGGPHPE